MARFISGISQEKPLSIAKSSVFWLVKFDLPDHIREKTQLNELRLICGDLLMGFYSDPLPGDFISYRGHKWKILERQFTPSRYNTKDPKKVPVLIVEYLDKTEFIDADNLTPPVGVEVNRTAQLIDRMINKIKNAHGEWVKLNDLLRSTLTSGDDRTQVKQDFLAFIQDWQSKIQMKQEMINGKLSIQFKLGD